MSSNCGIQVLNIPFECEYIVQGDTIAKTSFEVIEDGLDLTTASITIVVKQGNSVIIDYSVGNGITVIDSENFEIDEVADTDNNLPVGCFYGDLKIKDANDVLFTYSRIRYNIIKSIE